LLAYTLRLHLGHTHPAFAREEEKEEEDEEEEDEEEDEEATEVAMEPCCHVVLVACCDGGFIASRIAAAESSAPIKSVDHSEATAGRCDSTALRGNTDGSLNANR